jgi:hypothetical protein
MVFRPYSTLISNVRQVRDVPKAPEERPTPPTSTTTSRLATSTSTRQMEILDGLAVAAA